MTTNRISIVIPSYERPNSLRGVLQYWSNQAVDVIVVDGSDEPLFYTNDHSLSQNISYYHFPTSIEERLKFASDHLETDYACIVADDEILLYSALHKAADILATDLSYSAVIGATLGFKQTTNGFYFRGEYLTANELSIDSDEPLFRLNQRVSVTGNSIFYSLTRSTILQTAIEFIVSNGYSCPYIPEYQMEAILAGAGKVKVLHDLMWLRNRSGAVITHQSFDRNIYFYSWMLDPENAKQLSRLKESFEVYFGKIAPSANISGEYLVNLFSEYEKASISCQRPSSLLVRIGNYIRRSFVECLSAIQDLTPSRSFSRWFPADITFQMLKNAGVPYDSADFMEAMQAFAIVPSRTKANIHSRFSALLVSWCKNSLGRIRPR